MRVTHMPACRFRLFGNRTTLHLMCNFDKEGALSWQPPWSGRTVSAVFRRTTTACSSPCGILRRAAIVVYGLAYLCQKPERFERCLEFSQIWRLIRPVCGRFPRLWEAQAVRGRGAPSNICNAHRDDRHMHKCPREQVNKGQGRLKSDQHIKTQEYLVGACKLPRPVPRYHRWRRDRARCKFPRR